jgi:cytidyltransferase-like protein
MSVFVPGIFDDIRSSEVRLLQEAARLGDVTVLLWSDDAAAAVTGSKPNFSWAERRYFVESLHFVDRVTPLEDALDLSGLVRAREEHSDLLCVDAAGNLAGYAAYCRARGIEYRIFSAEELTGYPGPAPGYHSPSFGRPKVVVTGCYDWFHTGHIRFFEEASKFGELHVVLGSDVNLELLKGPGHPMYREQERKYLVQSVRFVERAYIASGTGWLDAEPEIRLVRPAVYAVNEDGDKQVKREYCEQMGIEYVVMKREPKKGLPRRTSTDLRGF